jgi:predicted dithiol-disulfide oxidoreductase (DUF899 family)
MPEIVTRQQWLEHRLNHLADEKNFNRLRDELSAKRREMPWVEVEEDYQFTGDKGTVRLSELFGRHSQLIVYHFMYGEDWQEGCPSCSFWADNFDGIKSHLGARDAGFAVISVAPYKNLTAYKKRMGWDFTWVSSLGNSFNQDYHVSFDDDQRANGEAIYNYKTSTFPSDEAPGVSIFTRDENDKIYHTYSTYSRGLDMLNGTYHFMDLLPKGRDEAKLAYPQAWVKRHDTY